ncbi:MAG: hypothetical protein R3A10_13130 [Caldilineaceae bacterium]
MYSASAPLFVRYNTGRSLDDNGRLLADLLTPDACLPAGCG